MQPRPGWLLRGVKALEHAGYSVVLDPEIATGRRFKRMEDERRAENFMGVWLDPKVKAVIGGTGGYGAVRMLPYLEPEVFRRNPEDLRRLLGHHGAASLADAAIGAAHLSRAYRRRSDSEHARPDNGVAAHRAHDAAADDENRQGDRARGAPGQARRGG